MDRVGFVSLPNRCNGCPLDIPSNTFRVINRCDLVDNKDQYKIDYHLNDLGKQICRVKKKQNLRKVMVVVELLTNRNIKDIRHEYKSYNYAEVKRVTIHMRGYDKGRR